MCYPSRDVDTGAARRPPRRKNWLDRRLAALDGWTKRVDTLTKFLLGVGALIAALVAIFGLLFRGCAPGPGPGPTPTPVTTDTAPTSTPSASTPPPSQASTGPSVVVREPLLRWVSKRENGVSLDGSSLLPGEEIWLEELYPGAPPSQFRVEQVHDPALGPALSDPTFVTTFGVLVTPPRAHSDLAWRLPEPPPSSGTATYRFRDEIDRRSGLINVAKLATMALNFQPTTPGKVPVVSLPASEGRVLHGEITFEVGSRIEAQVLVPWGSGDTDLLAYAQAYYQQVAGDQAAAEAAFKTFLNDNQTALPRGAPDQWQLGVSPGEMEAAAGESVGFDLNGALPRGGTTLMAIKVIDTQDRSRVVVSPIFRLEVAPPADTAPRLVIDKPSESEAREPFDVTDLDPDKGWYLGITLEAFVEDDDETIPEENIVWTTDQVDLQPAELGRGRTVKARLFPRCETATHLVTVTATDGAGHAVSDSRPITVRLIC
jgi:hypothetical protein